MKTTILAGLAALTLSVSANASSLEQGLPQESDPKPDPSTLPRHQEYGARLEDLGYHMPHFVLEKTKEKVRDNHRSSLRRDQGYTERRGW